MTNGFDKQWILFWWNANQVKDYLDISNKTLYRLTKEGRLHVHKISGVRWYRIIEVKDVGRTYEKGMHRNVAKR